MIQFGKKYPATKYLVIVALVMVVFLRTLRKKAIELKNIKLWDAAPMITYEVSLDYDQPFKELGIDVSEEYNFDDSPHHFTNIRNIERNSNQAKEQFQTMNKVAFVPMMLTIVGAVCIIAIAGDATSAQVVNASVAERNLLDEKQTSDSNTAGGQASEQPVQVKREQTIVAATPEVPRISNSELPWYLILINDDYEVPKDYEAKLVSVEGKQVDKRIADSLKEMLAEARKAGMSCRICSAYRTPEKQKSLVDADVKKYKARGYDDAEALELTYLGVSPVNHSEHQTGLTVDIISTSHQVLDAAHANTKEAKWLKEHCKEYGFIVRYTEDKVDITHRKAESWHFRFVGVNAARYIMDNNLSLEEYVEMYISGEIEKEEHAY